MEEREEDAGWGEEPPEARVSLLPSDVESSPRWRWPSLPRSPGDGEDPNSPPSSSSSDPTSFRDSPFDFWGDGSKGKNSFANWRKQRQQEQEQRQEADAAGQQRGRPRGGQGKPRLSDFASRLFRNQALKELAMEEMQQREDDTATASRWGDNPSLRGSRPGSPVPPPDVDNIRDAKEFDRQFNRWLQYKSEERTQRREGRQDDEIWGLARIYLAVAAAIIVFGLASGI
jgi:hypothetical protein